MTRGGSGGRFHLRKAETEHGTTVALLEDLEWDAKCGTSTRLTASVEMHEAVAIFEPELWILSRVSIVCFDAQVVTYSSQAVPLTSLTRQAVPS